MSAHEIEIILTTLGVEKQQMIPTNSSQRVLRDQEKFNQFCSESNIFPLEWFDKGYEKAPSTRYGSGNIKWLRFYIWIKNNVSFVLIGFAFLPDSLHQLHDDSADFNWLEVSIEGHDLKSNKWRVKELKTETIFVVPKIYLMFPDEKSTDHAKLIQQAVQLRNECENHLRFDAVLDGMALSEFPKPEQKVQDKIRQLLVLPFNVRWIEIFEREYCILHQKTLAATEMINFYAQESHFFPMVKLSEPKHERKNQITVVADNEKRVEMFKKSQKHFQRIWLYSCPEAMKIMKFLNDECDKISQMQLFDIPTDNDWSWVDLVQANNKKLDEISKFFKESCVESIAKEVKNQLDSAEKGWLDLIVNDWGIYRMTKLFRLIELIKQRMEAALRFMLRNSLQLFFNRLCHPCESMTNIEEDFVWGSDLVSSWFPSSSPLFSIKLDIVNGAPAYSTNIKEFEKEFVKMFKSRILASQEVPQIDPILLRHLKFEQGLKVPFIGFLDDEIQVQIYDIRRSYLICQIPLNAYAREFRKFVDFKNLVVNDYVQCCKESKKTAKEIKYEISFQLSSIDEIEITVPSEIFIGPVKVCLTLKKDLILKRRELFEKLLVMYEEKLHEKLEVISKEFEEIVNKLLQKSESIEELVAVRQWLPEIPLQIEQIQNSIEQMTDDFEVLDSFLINLSDDSMRLKFSSQMMPQHIRQKMEEAKLRHQHEFERFHRLQAAQEAQFLDQIEVFAHKVQDWSSKHGSEYVSEVSEEMSDLWGVSNEMLSQGELLNSRQIIFEQPEINLELLNDSVERLRPHFKLWSMTSDFYRSKESWKFSPLSCVDISDVQEKINQCESILQNSRDYFASDAEMLMLIENISKDVEEFCKGLDVMKDLKNPDFQPEHMNIYTKRTNIHVTYTPEMNFDSLIALGFLKNATIVKQVSLEATREREQEEIQKIKAEQKRLVDAELLIQKKARHAARMHIFN